MKEFFKYEIPLMACWAIIILGSCNKSVDTLPGSAKIYMTSAVSNPYMVPGDVKNYMADKVAKKLLIPVYIFRSGLQAQKTYSVNISPDDSAAAALIGSGLVDSTKAMIAPTDVYAMPSSAMCQKDSSSFNVVFDANKLNPYLGKLLIISIRLTDPSRFQLNEKLSVLNVVLDVDAVMLGAKTDVTDQYIVNSGHPFTASAINPSDTRRGVLAGWVESKSVENLDGGGYGGWDNYGDGGFMSMERYGSPQIPNGKIYQTIKLPAGKYVLTAAFLDYGITDQAYLTAALGDSLPDISDINSTLGFTPFGNPSLTFVVDNDGDVSLGILANLLQDQQWFRLDKIRLYQYQNLF